jgi:hypothetical protein
MRRHIGVRLRGGWTCVHLCDPRAGLEGNSFAEFALSYVGFRERDLRLIREC